MVDTKYMKIDTIFRIRLKGDDHDVLVYPFNGETEKFTYLNNKMENDVSWSHGMTHLKYIGGDYCGFCGVSYFEKNAVEVEE